MPGLAEFLEKYCQSLGVPGNVALLELMSVTPGQALQMLVPMKNQVLAWHERKQSFKSFMAWFVTVGETGKSVLTGSCGQTSGWLDDITTKGGKAPPQDVVPAATAVEQMRQITAQRWFARVSSGSHSFLIEFDGTNYCVYQSFFGAQSIQASIQNLLAGKFVFSDKAQFFDLLESALLDANTLMRVGLARLQREAEDYARQRGAAFGFGDFDRLVEARAKMILKPPPQAARELVERAPKPQTEALDRYDTAYDLLDDRAQASGTAQARLCHGSMWATSATCQVRLNLAPATDEEMAKTLQVMTCNTETEWAQAFNDPITSMEDHLIKFGVLDPVVN